MVRTVIVYTLAIVLCVVMIGAANHVWQGKQRAEFCLSKCRCSCSVK